MGVGTLGYQAPEQISGHPTIHSDLYSVGAQAVELFTGRNPTTMLDGMRLRCCVPSARGVRHHMKGIYTLYNGEVVGASYEQAVYIYTI